VDYEDLSNHDLAGGLVGLTPLIQRAVIDALNHHAAFASEAAIAGRLSRQDLAALAEQAVDHELLDLAEPPGPYYPTLPQWVDEWLLPVYRRSVSGHQRAWCPQWWQHPEAVARLDALWRAWEHLRLDAATGMSVWFRDHADHHMTILLDADGPLKGCNATHSARPLEPLEHEPPPPGAFEPDDRFIPSTPADAAGVQLSSSHAVGRHLKIGRVR
jgi:hypothetical protein